MLNIGHIHLIIIYGSPGSKGFYQVIGKTMSAEMTIIFVIIMITLMVLISLRIDKFRSIIKWKLKKTELDN